MAKRKDRGEVNPSLINAFQGKRSDSALSNIKSIDAIADMAFESISTDEKDKFVMMFTLASNGITPEEYAKFYDLFQASVRLSDTFQTDPDDNDTSSPISRNKCGSSGCEIKEYIPLKDAEDSTLVLRIQMKGVTKPPMWREVEIPANFNFMQLHEVIQGVTGLEDCHLWQFNAKAYDESLQIGVEMDEDDLFAPALDFVTHDAEETPVTQFLQHKGDKLEYVYDFGDDWIFVVEVKDLLAKKADYPVCTKFKSDLNAIDNFGGIYRYQQARNDLEGWGKLSKKEKKQRLEDYGFDSEEDYLDFLNQYRISLDDINDDLKWI